MRRSILGLMIVLQGCASIQVQDSRTLQTMTGEYRYIDGDRLVTRCGEKECVYTLIRDEFLSRQPSKLIGYILTLKVQVVDACGPDSSELACVRSTDGKALKIVHWENISPK